MAAFLHARHAPVFRFVVNTITNVRFGAENRFHYLFRAAGQQLVVPRLGTEVRPAMECSYEAERLFRQMQQLAPHKENYWQKAHISLLHLFVTQLCWETIIRQLTATSAAAAILQHSALRQIAVLLEFGGLQCVSSKDTNISGACLSPGRRVLFTARTWARQLQASPVRRAAASSMPSGFVRVFDHTRYGHARWFEKTLVFESALLASRGCRRDAETVAVWFLGSVQLRWNCPAQKRESM